MRLVTKRRKRERLTREWDPIKAAHDTESVNHSIGQRAYYFEDYCNGAPFPPRIGSLVSGFGRRRGSGLQNYTVTKQIPYFCVLQTVFT